MKIKIYQKIEPSQKDPSRYVLVYGYRIEVNGKVVTKRIEGNHNDLIDSLMSTHVY